MTMDWKRQSLLDAVQAAEKKFKQTNGKTGHHAAHLALTAARKALAKHDGVPVSRVSTVHPHHHKTEEIQQPSPTGTMPMVTPSLEPRQ
jgi:hypothetical protein